MFGESMSCGFPFELLHAEIVQHAVEREAQRELLKKQLSDSGDRDEKLLARAFAHHSAATSLESLGWRVGYVLTEKLSRDSPKLANELEVMKFVCKDLWICCFGKQVDNLRTNHQGVYVVQENKLATLSAVCSSPLSIKHAGNLLAFPCGLIRGALSALAVTAQVTTSVDTLPAVKFHIQIEQKLTK